MRTAEQTQTAVFWQVDTPAAMWNRVADELADATGTTLTQNARLLALMNVALADATIAIWNAKNTYDFLATHHGDPRADRSRLGTAIGDACVPEVSIRALRRERCSRIGARLLLRKRDLIQRHFGGLPNVERDFTSFSSAVQQIEDARIYAGFHFRFSCVDGATIGAQVADYVTHTLVQPVHGNELGQLGR